MATVVRLSELPSYKTAVVAGIDHNFDVARAAYRECINICRAARDAGSLALLLQMLGDMEAEAGNLNEFERCHAEAIALDPRSRLPRFFYARSLFRYLKHVKAAEAELGRVESMLATSNFPCDDGELPLSYYEREIGQLRAEIANAPEP